jgi:hypothetical protein
MHNPRATASADTQHRTNGSPGPQPCLGTGAPADNREADGRDCSYRLRARAFSVRGGAAAFHGGCCVNGVLSAPVKTIRGMAPNFIGCDREQEFLLPPILRAWLAEDHLAWFVIDAVAAMDMAAFASVYRVDGHGRPAHDPAMMVALLLYAYAIGERSSRRIERRCVEDVATRVICANRAPDHTTIARFTPAPRGGAGRPVRRGARVVRGCRARAGGRGRDRRHQGERECVGARDARLRADRARNSRGGRGDRRARG